MMYEQWSTRPSYEAYLAWRTETGALDEFVEMLAARRYVPVLRPRRRLTTASKSRPGPAHGVVTFDRPKDPTATVVGTRHDRVGVIHRGRPAMGLISRSFGTVGTGARFDGEDGTEEGSLGPIPRCCASILASDTAKKLRALSENNADNTPAECPGSQADAERSGPWLAEQPPRGQQPSDDGGQPNRSGAQCLAVRT